MLTFEKRNFNTIRYHDTKNWIKAGATWQNGRKYFLKSWISIPFELKRRIILNKQIINNWLPLKERLIIKALTSKYRRK